MKFYYFAKGVVKSILGPLYRIETVGTEHFPKDGGVLLCSNHINNLDPPVVGISCPRPVAFMAKEELFKAPVLKHILPHVHAFPVKRGMSDREALRTGMKILKENNVLGLFPEGTRSKNGELGKGSGRGRILCSAYGSCRCSMCHIGSYKPFRKLKVIFGHPVDLDGLRAEKANAEEVTEVIMAEIQKLLDEHQ